MRILLLLLLMTLTSCANIYQAYQGHGLEYIGDVNYFEVPKYVRDRQGKYTKEVERVPYVLDGEKSCFEHQPRESIITVPWKLREDVLRIFTVTKAQWDIEARKSHSEVLFVANSRSTPVYEVAHCSYSTFASELFMQNYWFVSIKLGKPQQTP